MRSSTGTKLYAVRDESGKFKDIQTYKRAHAADLRHKSKAEKVAAQGPLEKKVRKAANDAVKSVKSSRAGRRRCGGAGSETGGEAGCEPAAGGEENGEGGRREGDPQAGREEGHAEGREKDGPQAGGEKDREEGGEDEVTLFEQRSPATIPISSRCP